MIQAWLLDLSRPFFDSSNFVMFNYHLTLVNFPFQSQSAMCVCVCELNHTCYFHFQLHPLGLWVGGGVGWFPRVPLFNLCMFFHVTRTAFHSGIVCFYIHADFLHLLCRRHFAWRFHYRKLLLQFRKHTDLLKALPELKEGLGESVKVSPWHTQEDPPIG